MQFFILVLIFCFFIFLFALYRLSQDDFIFIRKGISTESIFNLAFFTAVISLTVARFVYVFSFPKAVFFTPLGFLLFPYFPGLSFVGGVLGGAIFLTLYCFYKKFPISRTLDFFAISFLTALPFSFVFTFFISQRNMLMLVSLIFYLLFLILTYFILLKFLAKGKIKDGGIGLLFLIIFCAFTIVINFFSAKFQFIFSIENSLLIFALIFTIPLFMYRQFIAGKSS